MLTIILNPSLKLHNALCTQSYKRIFLAQNIGDIPTNSFGVKVAHNETHTKGPLQLKLTETKYVKDICFSLVETYG